MFIPGEEFVNIFIQLFRNDLLDLFFILVSGLLTPLGLLIILMSFLWIVEKRTSIVLAILVLGSNYINWFLKTSFSFSRPYLDFPGQIALIGAPELTYGFPSQHAQNIATISSFLSARYKKIWVWVLSIILMLLVAFSRLYLGVHYLSDIMVGLLIGIAFIGLYIYFEEHLIEFWNRFTFNQKMLLAILLPLILFFGGIILFPGSLVEDMDNGLICGALFGGMVGVLLEDEYVKLERKKISNRIRVFRVILGVPLVVLSYIVLSFFKFGITEGIIYGLLHFARYSMLGIVATLICPIIFVNLEKRFFREK